MTLPLNEALSIFDENLADIRVACIENAQAHMKECSPYKVLGEEDEMTQEQIHLHVNYLHMQKKVEPLLKMVKRIDSYRYFTDPKNQNASMVTDLDIQNAREADADWFISQAELSTRRPNKGVCPFHPDKNPSLVLMRSKRTGHMYLKCFACGWWGDSIKYIMDRDNLSFTDAVKYIVC